MGSRSLLQVMSPRLPNGERGAILTAAGIVAALVLTLSAAAVVQITSGNLRGVFASSDSRQARGAASEGIELMIATWNQPLNRALLVSGEDPATWTVDSLASPCVSSALPDPTAIELADGAWRDGVTGAEADKTTDGRQFRLIGISYSAAPPGNIAPNPYELRRSFGAAGSDYAQLPPPAPSGPPISDWRDLVNLEPVPPGAGINPTLLPGEYTGLLTLIVEGRVVRDSRVVANSRLTQEFEVLPKCCGLSLGSGGAGSLGADRRPDPPDPPDQPGCPAEQDWVARGPTSSRLW